MVRIFALKVTEQDFEEEVWRPYLSPARRAAAERMRRKKERQLFLGAEALLNRALKRLTPDADIPAVYERNVHGKPYLLPPNENVYVNWSHSGDYVLCALADREVGADLQLALKEPGASLVRRTLQPNERAFYEAGREEKKKMLFYRYWTLKESFLKALGTGFTAALSDFYIDMGEETPRIVQNINEKSYQCCLLDFADKDYAAAVCCEGSEALEGIEIEYLA